MFSHPLKKKGKTNNHLLFANNFIEYELPS
jgi:hypothetical protein